MLCYYNNKMLKFSRWFKKLKIKHSFTIIELSVALVVAGIIAGGGFTAYKNSNPQLRSDLKKIQKIQEKMQSFFNTNGRLPYPASHVCYSDSEDCFLKESKTNNIISSCSKVPDIENGIFVSDCGNYVNCTDKEQCENVQNNTIVWGVVPTRTLGLPDDYAYDSSGHNFEYITNSSLTTTIGTQYAGEYEKTNYVASKTGNYGVLFENVSNKNNIQIPLDLITVKNHKTKQFITNSSNNVAYAIVSKGKTKKCYFDTKAQNKNNQNVPDDDTKYNCVFNYSNSGNFKTLELYQGYSKDFDNIVVIDSLSDMIYKNANAKESTNQLTQGNIIQYQPRIDRDLKTERKDIVGSINEVDYKLKFVESFKGIEGERKQLYYLYVDQDIFKDKNGVDKTYRRGLYIYNEDKDEFKLVSGGGGGAPVGSIIAFSGEHVPSGYLLCDGKAYDRFVYKELFDIIGEKYGVGDGVKTFNVPDLTDKIPWQSGGLSGSKALGKAIPAGIPNIKGSFFNTQENETSIPKDPTGAFTRTRREGNGADGTYGWFETISFNASSGATTSGIYRDDATIVQPPAISMKYIIKYTDDMEQFKEYEQKVNDFSDEVKKQLADVLKREYICNNSYPVGSIYINATNKDEPQVILGCGVWEEIEPNNYLMSSKSPYDGSTNKDYDAYNDSYGNFANTYLSECLPNITGSLNYYNGYGSGGGGAISVWVVNSNWLPSHKEENTSRYCASFNAANGSVASVFTKQKIFRNKCGAVRPQTYAVYIWRRIG